MQYILVVIASLFLVHGLYGLYSYRWKKLTVVASQLPSVSLLIPARNETHIITRALDNALSLDYPKLEIIVLDDQSQDRTSEKIRAFAHDGVRFIAGEEMPNGWVGKNWANHQLAQAASGKYFIFCDVDVALNSKTLTRLVRLLEQKSISCASIYPRLILEHPVQSIFMPLIPYWLLSIPLSIVRRQPVYGGLLAFDADSYRQHGGYQRYSNDMLAEFSLARDFDKNNLYKFFHQSTSMRLYTYKRIASTFTSRVRYLKQFYTRYPVLGSMHMLLLVSFLATLFIHPLMYLVIALFYGAVNYWSTHSWILTSLLWPLTFATELILTIASFVMNKLNKVTWKNREL